MKRGVSCLTEGFRDGLALHTTGTPYWMAPEVITCSPSAQEGAETLSPGYSMPCDIWSVGITAIELAEGFPPYLLEKTPMNAMMLIVKNKPPSLNMSKETLPRTWSSKFKEFLAQLLNKDPKARPTIAQVSKHSFLTSASSKKGLAELKTLCRSLYPNRDDEIEIEWRPAANAANAANPFANTAAPAAQKADDPKQKLAVIEAENITNLSDLPETSEDAIVSILEGRFNLNHVFTNVGNILISCNPFKKLGIFSERYQRNFMDPATLSANQPHIYTLALRAYSDYVFSGKSQSCVISGISGAGKTESAKQFIRHVVALSTGELVGESDVPLVQKLMAMSHILEAFGNAKTQQNSNSSRFGQYLSMKLDSSNKVHAAHLSTYLLEKSRVVSQGEGEQNYHVFYYMLATSGRSEELTEGLELKEGAVFKYLAGGILEEEQLFKSFEDLTTSMRKMGFGDPTLKSLFIALATSLHVGQIGFTERADGSLVVATRETLATIGNLLRLADASIEAHLCSTTTVTRGEQITIQLNQEMAEDTRDALAKSIYCRLFAWIVQEMNVHLSAESDDKQIQDGVIGVLDIFGFESQKCNSFEQLCINAANEQLHHFFNEHIFKWELKELEEEGMSLANISYSNNQSLLDLMFGRPVGFLSLLDEESFFPKATTESLLQKLQKNFKKSPDLEIMRGGHVTDFSIKHFAGKVTYSGKGFLSKNRDVFSENFQTLLSNSPNAFLAMLFTAEATVNGTYRFDLAKAAAITKSQAPVGTRKKSRMASNRFSRKTSSEGKPVIQTHKDKYNMKKSVKRYERKAKKANQGTKKITLAMQFKSSLAELMTKVMATSPHFVRCIKPNTSKVAGRFDRTVVSEQLRSTGVLETVRIRRQGYAIRLGFGDFLAAYGVLLPSAVLLADNKEKMQPQSACQAILENIIKAPADQDQATAWVIGRSRVLMKHDCSEILKVHMRHWTESAVKCQRFFRRHALRSLLQRRREARKAHYQRMIEDEVPALTSSMLEGFIQNIAEEIFEGSKKEVAAHEQLLGQIADIEVSTIINTFINTTVADIALASYKEETLAEQAAADEVRLAEQNELEEEQKRLKESLQAASANNARTADERAQSSTAVNSKSRLDPLRATDDNSPPEPTPRPSLVSPLTSPLTSPFKKYITGYRAGLDVADESQEAGVLPPTVRTTRKERRKARKARKKETRRTKKAKRVEKMHAKQQAAAEAAVEAAEDSADFGSADTDNLLEAKSRKRRRFSGITKIGGMLKRLAQGVKGTRPTAEERVRTHIHEHLHAPVQSDTAYSAVNPAIQEWESPLQPFSMEEYDTLDQNLCGYDELPENIEHLNRYQNVLANFRTRVPIRPTQDNPEGYINANFVSGFDGTPKVYIAAQGPKPETIYHFWQMIWECDARAIIMVTGLEEAGRTKCARYWPNVRYNPEMRCGDLQLNDINIAVIGGYRKNSYITSKLRVQRGSEVREIRHFWYDTWPDHGVPNETWPVAAMLRGVRAWSNEPEKPWVVHCSAGIGRTGTFIGIDQGMHQLMQSKEVNVNAICHNLRQHRGGMVQHGEQAIFMHTCLETFAVRIAERMEQMRSDPNGPNEDTPGDAAKRGSSRLGMLYPSDHPQTADTEAVLAHALQRADVFATDKVHKSQVHVDEGEEDRIPSWRAAQLARNKEKVHHRLQRAQLSASDSPKVARAQTKLVVQLSHQSDIENLVDSLAVDSL